MTTAEATLKLRSAWDALRLVLAFAIMPADARTVSRHAFDIYSDALQAAAAQLRADQERRRKEAAPWN
jgi:hypothetical protein